MIQVAIYARVSTDDQDCERQVSDLTAWAARLGVEVVGTWRETGSGAKRDRQLRADVLKHAKAKRFSAVLVTEASRWSRSTVDLLDTLDTLASYCVSLKALNGLDMDLSTPHGRLIATILASIAEFERGLIGERVKSGIAAAKARGQTVGRLAGFTPAQAKHRDRVLELTNTFGFSLRRCAAREKIAVGTVRAILSNEAKRLKDRQA